MSKTKSVNKTIAVIDERIAEFEHARRELKSSAAKTVLSDMIAALKVVRSDISSGPYSDPWTGTVATLEARLRWCQQALVAGAQTEHMRLSHCGAIFQEILDHLCAPQNQSGNDEIRRKE